MNKYSECIRNSIFPMRGHRVCQTLTSYGVMTLLQSLPVIRTVADRPQTFFSFFFYSSSPFSQIDGWGRSFITLAPCGAVKLQTQTIWFEAICHELLELQATFVLFVHLDAALGSCESRLTAPWVQFPFFFLLAHTERPHFNRRVCVTVAPVVTVTLFLREQSQQIPSRPLYCQFCRMLEIPRIEIVFLQFPRCHSKQISLKV